jgi:hypothetical protein
MASNRKQRRTQKKDSLLTILATEATSDSRKLLKKYNLPDAKNYNDLEQKLADLYTYTADKVQLEKEMAAIHPHRKWLEKYIEPKVEVVETKVEEATSNADGYGCGCCEPCRQQRRAMNRASCPCAMNRNWEQMSNAEGITESKQQKISAMDLIGPIGLIGILTIGFIAIIKTTK